MPQSLSNILLHLIFSTKNRFPFPGSTFLSKTHAYLAATAREINCECYRVGETRDYVHLAVRLPRTLTAAKLVETLKSSSSK